MLVKQKGRAVLRAARALDAKPADVATAAAALGEATTVSIEPVLVADVNALLCVSVSNAQAVEIATRANEYRAAK